MIKLVVADIDNTLVPKHKGIHEATVKAINDLKAQGILFGLASGRGAKSLKNFETDWGIKCDLLIGLNGGDLYDYSDNSYKLYYKMEKQWAREIIDIMKPFDCVITTNNESIRMASKMDERMAASERYNKHTIPLTIPEDIYELASIESDKVCCRIYEEDWPKIEKRLSEYTFTDYVPFRTEFTMLEFCNVHSQKGNILKIYCEKHGINLEEVAAFGDLTNDISMLRVAGMSVCMLNGSDDAKAVSKYITEKTVDEDGFADFVNKHILNK